MHLYPIRLVPRSCSRVWGGHLLEDRFGRPASGGEPVGECWEIHGELPVANGPYRGLSLDELARRHPADLLGRCPAPGGTFPLLVKWLDCQGWLSVQVHPDDAVARRLTGDPEARGKTECWYIVEAAGQAELIHGLVDGLAPADLARYPGSLLVPCLKRLRPRAGDLYFTPAGVVHALGPGLLVLEVQQSSDLTYRLYDWDRPGLDGSPRPLHQAEAFEVLRDSEVEGRWPDPPGSVGRPLLACSHFALESLEAPSGWSPEGQSPEILALVRGRALVEVDGGDEVLAPGDVVLVPAVARKVRLDLEPGALALRVRIPGPGPLPARQDSLPAGQTPDLHG